MAISPKNRYNANQIDQSDPTNYPEGKAKNISALGNTDGTPYEEDLVNDIFGFQQAILKGAAFVPSGNPDTATNSQYLDALRRICQGGPLIWYQESVATQFIMPAWVNSFSKIKIWFCGGGGGGGGNYFTATTSAIGAAGGGGGSGRARELNFGGVELPAGTVIDFTPGAGGVRGEGGSQVTDAQNGGSGGDTIVSIPSLGINATARGGSGGSRGIIAVSDPSSGNGGDGWCGGGGGSSVNQALSSASNGGGGFSYGSDTRFPGLTGNVGSTEPFTNQTGIGGFGGWEGIFAAPGQWIERQRIQYFGGGSDGGNRQDFGTNKRGSAGGGGGPSSCPYWIPDSSIYKSQNGFNTGDTNTNIPNPEYWESQGKRGHGPGGGGGGGGNWFLISDFTTYFGGRGAFGAVVIEIR